MTGNVSPKEMRSSNISYGSIECEGPKAIAVMVIYELHSLLRQGSVNESSRSGSRISYRDDATVVLIYMFLEMDSRALLMQRTRHRTDQTVKRLVTPVT